MTTRQNHHMLAALLLKEYEGRLRFEVAAIDQEQAEALANALQELDCHVELHPLRDGRMTVIRLV